MTGRTIDHIVLAVRNLDEAASTYKRLGFTLTPRAFHEDRMGTSNRLAQFEGRNFIELLEVDRPDLLQPHDFLVDPPFFSFGDHNRAATSDSMTMLVFASDDACADHAAFRRSGVPTYAPFDFERLAKLPDGNEVTVAFSLAFTTAPEMPGIAFFVCQNRAQNYFWKPAFQKHANGASTIKVVYLASDDPQRDSAFVGKMFGGRITATRSGMSVACGPRQSVHVLLPERIAELDPSFRKERYSSPVFAGIEISARDAQQPIPSADAHGIFIAWATADP